MSSIPGASKGSTRWVWGLVALAFMGCELDVADPAVVRDDELAGPASVPTVINGVIGDLATATEHYTLYASMFTDEMILAGTFPTRLEVDERRIVRSNATVTGEVAENLQVARSQAQTMASNFEGFLGDDDFSDVEGQLLEGIAIGKYVEGLMLLQMGVLYCETPIKSGGSALPSNQIVSQAFTAFEEAESAAQTAGLSDWEQAALVGQARAQLWLGNHGQARTIAGGVDAGHRLFVEYSTNDPDQFNKVFDLTHGSQNQVIRWTVGDGTQSERANEKFALYDLFADSLGIVDPDDPDLSAFNSSISVQAQLIYDEPDDDILLSNGLHARLIEAEALIRSGNAGCDQALLEDCTGTAEELLDVVRMGSDTVPSWDEDARGEIPSWQQRWTSERFRVDAGVGDIDGAAQAEFGADFEDLTTEQQLLLLADDVARETWLSGVRQEMLRRYVEEFGAGTQMDLYPVKPGDQICWPIPEQEDTGATP